MCISDNTRRRSLLGSTEAAAFLAEAVLDGESQESEFAPNNYPNNQRTYKRMTFSSIIPKPTTMAMASALGTDETPECPSSRQHCVQHNYHDHAGEVEGMYQQKPAVSKGGVSVPFPMKLHDMLEHIQRDEPELASIVSWQPHGRCFLVHEPKEFAQHVLPRFFQQKKYASFQRQLNLYGFSRITRQGPDRGSYYHEFFLRGKKFLCRGINRMKVKGTGARMASNPDAEPDFYSMTPIASTPNSVQSSESGSSTVSASSSESEQGFTTLSMSTVSSAASIGMSLQSQIDHLSGPINNSNNNNATFQQMQQTQSWKNPSINSNTSIAPLPATSSSFRTNTMLSNPPEQQSASDLVFGDMAFHSLDMETEAAKFRRHSLMDPRGRRSSLLKNVPSSASTSMTTTTQQRSSATMDVMDSILRMFQSDDLTDEEVGVILNDIIAL